MWHSRIGFVGALACASLWAQHAVEGEGKKHPALGDPQAIAEGQKLYMASCAGCHGPKGQGGRGPNLRHRGMWHPLDDNELFKTIQKGVPGADMPATNLPEDKIWQLVAFVRSLTAPAIENRVPGNPEAGERVFWSAGAGCSNCHRILGRGGMLGPDLSNIGATKPVEEIRESVVDPHADGFHHYRAVTAFLKNGKSIQGVARNRTNYSIQIQDAQGQLHLLSIAEVADLKISPRSPMPGDYAKRLTPQQLEDLIAYLSRQSVRPYNAAEKK
ncbi:MAG: c-type cytochrome [Bryobacteraceae bacterium]|nr:c-type cytochrome [Bryobacteraceae bacterium]MDW8379226.1 c-type cytochrome [Bryobacterales bacterium]